MAFIARLIAAISIAGLAACAQSPNSRQFVGAGIDLYTPSTDRDTGKLLAYLDALCRQAGLEVVQGEGTHCPRQMPSDYFPVLVRTGFNDIDLRCDRYLNYIDVKRIEALQFKGGLSAAQTFLGVVSSADTLRYVVAAFGFADSIYDKANISMLAALESSTIKTLVYKRQKAFRAEAAARPATDRAAMIFALRNYLAICTPQTIVLKANTFSRDPGSGTDDAIRTDYRELFANHAAARPLGPRTDFGSPGNVGPPPVEEDCTAQKKVFSQSPCLKTRKDVEIAQVLLCLPDAEVDGLGGPNTTFALSLFEIGQYGAVRDTLLNDTEYDTLQSQGCRHNERSIYRNYWELREYKGKPNNLRQLIAELNLAYPLSGDIQTDALSDLTLRSKVVAAAAEMAAGTVPTTGQITPEIRKHIRNKARDLATN